MVLDIWILLLWVMRIWGMQKQITNGAGSRSLKFRCILYIYGTWYFMAFAHAKCCQNLATNQITHP